MPEAAHRQVTRENCRGRTMKTSSSRFQHGFPHTGGGGGRERSAQRQRQFGDPLGAAPSYRVIDRLRPARRHGLVLSQSNLKRTNEGIG
jgi:hypothetical protein